MLKLKRRGALWYVHFTDLTGARQRLSTGERDETRARIKAAELVQGVLASVTTADARDLSAKDYTLGMALLDAYQRRWANQKSSKPKRYLVQALARDVGFWPLSAINFSKLEAYADTLAKRGDAPATRNRKLSAIQTAMKEAQKRGLIQHLPPFPHFAENNVKERYVTPEEERRIVDHIVAHSAPADTEGPYLAALVPFLLDTGMRAGEVLGITPANDQGRAVSLLNGSTKNGKGRVVPLTKRARACLDVMLASPHHGRVSVDWVGRRFRGVVEKLGIEDVTLHVLRHTCATRLLQAGRPLYLVSQWLGHSSLEVTTRYAHWAPNDFAAAAEALEAFGGGTVPRLGESFPKREACLPAAGTLSSRFPFEISALLGAKGETRTLTGCPTGT